MVKRNAGKRGSATQPSHEATPTKSSRRSASQPERGPQAKNGRQGAASPAPSQSSITQFITKTKGHAAVSEAEIKELANSLAFYVLSLSSIKHPFNRAELTKAILQNRNPKCYAAVLKQAAESLDVIFGIRLVAVDSKPLEKSDKMILVNGIASTKMFVELNEDCKEQAGLEVLLVLVLNCIHMSGGSIPEDQLLDFLVDIKIQPGDTASPGFGNIPAKMNLYKSQLYIKYELDRQTNPPTNIVSWGTRAHAEVSKKEVLEFVREIYHDMPYSGILSMAVQVPPSDDEDGEVQFEVEQQTQRQNKRPRRGEKQAEEVEEEEESD
ncbi:hypothetical protein B566_EDAN015531 [Ephemera danica]|nr:hypothetical protein B566_EDAN015531 [Ephemera danica]